VRTAGEGSKEEVYLLRPRENSLESPVLPPRKATTSRKGDYL